MTKGCRIYHDAYMAGVLSVFWDMNNLIDAIGHLLRNKVYAH